MLRACIAAGAALMGLDSYPPLPQPQVSTASVCDADDFDWDEKSWVDISAVKENSLYCKEPYDNAHQPRSLVFSSLAELKNWHRNPSEADPFLVFNQATQKAKVRVIRKADRPKVAILDDRGPDSGGRCFDGPPQGAIDYKNEDGLQRSAFPRWVFGGWAYVDIYVYFSHTMFAIPPAGWTNAAHKNGVLSLGTIIFENNTIEQLNEMVRDKDLASSQALIALARTYGFDGYFINFEAGGVVDVEATYAFLERLQQQGLYVQWYDSVTTTGRIDYQNALTERNKPFFDRSSSIFTNYWWRPEQVSYSKRIAGDRFLDVFTGIDVYARGPCMNSEGEVISAMREILDKTSVAIFAPAWTFFKASPANRLQDYLKKDARLWLSQGVGGMITSNSPITELPFLTNFNTGQGTDYYRFGEKVSAHNWNHLSQQDVPLTFMYDEVLDDGGVHASEVYTTAYQGGTSLALLGRPDCEQTINLFKTNIPLRKNVNYDLSVVIAAGEQALSFDIYVSLDFSDGETTKFLVPDPGPSEPGITKWHPVHFGMQKFINKNIIKISLQITPKKGYGIHVKADSALMYFGELMIAEKSNASKIPPSIRITEFNVDKKIISWKKANYAFPCEYYEVFGHNAEHAWHFLGRAYTNAYFYGVNLMNNDITSSLDFTGFEVLCVDKHGNRSNLSVGLDHGISRR